MRDMLKSHHDVLVGDIEDEKPGLAARVAKLERNHVWIFCTLTGGITTIATTILILVIQHVAGMQ